MTRLPNVVLIGMPGAGKSTLGVVLAKIANMHFLDVDLVIQSRHRATLQTLIDRCGAEGFIELEGEALRSVDVENTVIATGGSAVYSEAAMTHLAKTGTVVYLEISYESLVERLGDLHERGVVMKSGADTDNVGGLRSLYDERRPLYEQAAEITVNIEGLDITSAARRVIDALPAIHAKSSPAQRQGA